MEFGGASDKEEPPCDPKRKEPNAKRAVKGDFHVCGLGNQRWPEKRCHHGHCQKIGLAHADLLYHKTKNIILLSCTPMVLIYNHELGVISSSKIFTQKNSGRRVMYSLVSLFLARCGGRLPHVVLRKKCFTFPISNCTE